MEHIALLIFLLVLSGFFSGAEIALFSLGAEKIQALKNRAKSTKRVAKIEKLERMKANSSRLLVTILIGNNVVNIASTSLATILAVEWAATAGASSDTTMLVGIVTGVMTFLILFFGEITPKALANKYSLGFSLIAAPILRVLQILLSPIVIPLASVVDAFASKSEPEHGLSEDELKAAIELSEKEGKIIHDEKELIEKALEFDEHTVGSIMTPRSKMYLMEDNTSLKEAISQISETKFSRIPVFHQDHDQIIGILTVHTLIQAINKKNISKKNVANIPLINPLKVPPMMKIHSLLKEFQEKKLHMALVHDEHGGLVGLITMEDIVEEIFGEIRDEQDSSVPLIQRVGKFSFQCHPDAELEHIENFLKEALEEKAPERFPWELQDENKSLNYFLLEQFERFPKKGESITLKQPRTSSFVFLVEKLKDGSIDSIKLTIKK